MPSLRKDLRSDLEKSIVKARDIAEAAATAALQALAVGEPKPFPHMDADARALRNRLRERGRAAGDVRNDFTTAQTIAHLAQLVAYEHWHRMIFARFLAENHLLLEPEHQVALSLDDVQELAREEGIDLWQLAGSYAQRMLPEVFRNDDPALEVALAREDRLKLEKLLADLDPATFTADDSLGWTYQFWQTKRKADVNASGVKIGADEISPVTQLFTEDYMVEFLLDNTLGAWWASGERGRLARTTVSEEDARNAVALPGCDWKYLRFVQGSAGVPPASLESESGQDAHAPLWTPAAGSFPGWPKTAADLRCLDPCMGSGHFITAMFHRLVALRMAEENLDEKAAVIAVIRDNLFGLEIDPRCTQIAAFNLALAAWRRVGHCKLPPMNLACSGLAPNTPEQEWVALAGDNDRLQRGMARLHKLFQNAPILGSLINPKAGGGDLLEADFHEVAELLGKALGREAEDNAAHEAAVTAHGLAKAAEILAGEFTIVATNVPYLGRGKQEEVLQDYCQRVHPEAKTDLATCFVQRCLGFCSPFGSTALVTPQNWLSLPSYSRMRSELLRTLKVDWFARLGARAFETIGGEVVNVALVAIVNVKPTADTWSGGCEVESAETPAEKSQALRSSPWKRVLQNQILKNPDARITLEAQSKLNLLSSFAFSPQGIKTGDDGCYRRTFWEIPTATEAWRFYQGTPDKTQLADGMHFVLDWSCEGADFSRLQGMAAWGRRGVVLKLMGDFTESLFLGEHFDSNVTAIIPNDVGHLPALWCFCASPEFSSTLKSIEAGIKVNNATAVKIPFDLAHWQKVAEEKYPDGLPKPFSSDPTQWLFNGHPNPNHPCPNRPKDAEGNFIPQPSTFILHVAVARLLGYRWPRQTGSSFPNCPALDPDGLEPFCDDDGIVCLTPLRGEAKAADRLRKLLDAAYGSVGVPPASSSSHSQGGQDARAPLKSGQDGHAPPWNERQLLTAAGAKSTTLEDWLRDEFFESHCKLFHHRPFLWHLWDGRPDGFHALVNYHQLAAPGGAGHKLLETLTYAYLGDWIRRQQDDANNEVPGAQSRLEAATTLQQELKNILQGEPPYDLFIRWKPLHQQPIGWHPDLNDGVRLNIRPFLYAKDVNKKDAGILRWKPNVKWTKDRGTEPQREKADFPWFWTWDEKTPDFPGTHKFDGNRWNDLHYSNDAKHKACQLTHQTRPDFHA
jgi:hypothetical protein